MITSIYYYMIISTAGHSQMSVFTLEATCFYISLVYFSVDINNVF